jgi:hypothetical protein
MVIILAIQKTWARLRIPKMDADLSPHFRIHKDPIRSTGRKDIRIRLKGHGNEADFLGFLHKSVRHRSLTLHFEPFQFWLRIRSIRGDIRNRKTTRRVGESTKLPIDTIFFKPLNKSIVILHYIPGLFFAKFVL